MLFHSSFSEVAYLGKSRRQNRITHSIVRKQKTGIIWSFTISSQWTKDVAGPTSNISATSDNLKVRPKPLTHWHLGWTWPKLWSPKDAIFLNGHLCSGQVLMKKTVTEHVKKNMAHKPCHKRIRREQSAERDPEMAWCPSCHSNVLRTAINYAPCIPDFAEKWV